MKIRDFPRFLGFQRFLSFLRFCTRLFWSYFPLVNGLFSYEFTKRLILANQCMKIRLYEFISCFLFIVDDHSRVILKPVPGDVNGSDYINASYIDVSRIASKRILNFYEA